MNEYEYPPTVIMDTTNVCNARCPFCPLFQGSAQFDRKIRPATVMPLDLYERLISEIASWPTRPYSLVHSANGEILQDPKARSRFDIIQHYGLPDITTLLTNAQYLDEQTANSILENEIGQLTIGFDGASKVIYEAHRVRCSYERVLTNIRNFAALRDKRGSKTKIWIKYVRTPRNEHEVASAFHLFQGFLDPKLDRFQDALSVDWSDELSTDPGLYYRHKVKDRPRRNSCTYFDTVLEIDADGIVAACCWDYNLTVSDGGLGSASEIPLLDIWRGQKRLALGRAHMPGGRGLPEKCQTCIIMHEPEPIEPDLARIDGRFLECTSDTSMIYCFRPE
jgi:MoaA/NifB/PqqE/SkfB family radical SAM enzyme